MPFCWRPLKIIEAWEVLHDDGTSQPGVGLCYFMIQHFHSGVNERGAVEAVTDLHQKPNESVDSFFSRVTLAMDKKITTSQMISKQELPIGRQ